MMKKILTFLLLLSALGLRAQFVEWGNRIQPDTNYYYGNNYVDALVLDDAENSYLTGSFDRKGAGAATNPRSTVIKYDKRGKELWVKNTDFRITAMATDTLDNNSLYLLVVIDTATTIGRDNYATPKKINQYVKGHSVILLKTDSAFNILWSRLITDYTGFFYSSTWERNDKIIVTPNEILVQQTTECDFWNEHAVYNFKGKLYEANILYGSGWNDNIMRVILRLEKNKQGSNNEWCLPTLENSFHHSSLDVPYAELEVDAEGFFYIKFYYSNLFYLGQTRYFTSSAKLMSSIVKISIADTTLQNRFDFEFAYWGMDAFTVLPDGKLVVSGRFRDTTTYRGQQYITPPNTISTLLFYLEKDGKKIWSIQEKNQDRYYGIYLGRLKYRRGKIYARGLLQRSLQSDFGGITVKAQNIFSPSQDGEMLLAKIDTFGNCLWMFTYSDYHNFNSVLYGFNNWYYLGLEIDDEGNAYLAENLYYTYNNKILDFQFPNQGSSAVIYKISDFEIIRGNVYPGPYCAGDTIDIPYTLKGKYYADNVFIAQLSDENGNFSGGERELGRLATNQNGVVKGILPLFNVNTSGKYRIRILSTRPVAQSNYREDTLRLLIYSRDTANAGNDTLICNGQPVQLSTMGGSRWQWSPAASINNAALRQPIARPVADTKYRIIISDSSGCGDTDTDYMWVFVRKPLDIQAPFADSLICRGQVVKLFAQGTGGDSAHHSIVWYERRANGDVLAGQGDSLAITATQTARTFFAVLWDSCTVQPDTQFYNLKIRDELRVLIKSNRSNITAVTDTLICYNAGLILYAAATGGNAKNHIISWSNPAPLGIGDSLVLAAAQPGTYYVKLTDNCTASPATAQLVVTQRPLLTVNIQTADSVCSRHPVLLQATISGGDSTQYGIEWRNAGSGWKSWQNPVAHTPVNNGRYIARATDNCSPAASDTVNVTLLPLPVPHFTVTNTYGCPPLQLQLEDKSQGNIAALNVWRLMNREVTGIASPTYAVDTGGVYTIMLSAVNKHGCADSIATTRQITVFDKPRADFIVRPEKPEIEAPVQLVSTSQRAITYQWDLGDGTFKYSSGDTSTVYYDTGNYTIGLAVTNGQNCKDTVYKNIRVYNRMFCVVPNAFTPNGDGLNPVFVPVCDGIQNYTLNIYNRWGQLIHQCQNCGWDGTYYGQPVEGGVYMYKVFVEGENQKTTMIFGNVNMIR